MSNEEVKPMDEMTHMEIDIALRETMTQKAEAKCIIADGQKMMAKAELREAQIYEVAARQAADAMDEQLEAAKQAEANAKEDAEIEKAHDDKESAQ